MIICIQTQIRPNINNDDGDKDKSMHQLFTRDYGAPIINSAWPN